MEVGRGFFVCSGELELLMLYVNFLMFKLLCCYLFIYNRDKSYVALTNEPILLEKFVMACGVILYCASRCSFSSICLST